MSIVEKVGTSKIMLLTNQLHASPPGGRELLCKLNYDALKEIYGDRMVLFELPRLRRHGFKVAVNAFLGHVDGLDGTVIRNALQTIQAENIVKIFVDGSNLGSVVKAVKQEVPSVEICTFFHNVEARFFLGSLRQNKTLRALAVLIVNYLAERKAVRYSDKIICLSRRDSCLLRKLYGRAATHVSPIALHDKLPKNHNLSRGKTCEKFALFVGGTFYANLAGITWYIKHVVPQIHIKVCIVGRGFDYLRPQLELEGKVVVIGAVDSLAEWYLNAHFVIAPIFDGSGMKTKVAEALMYGKKIIGTSEAFAGYEDIVEHAGWVCVSAREFIEATKRATDSVVKPFAHDLRSIYEEKYSYVAGRKRLADILRTGAW
jgi:glycosyltransferase involved in cell wall biosynthesis